MSWVHKFVHIRVPVPSYEHYVGKRDRLIERVNQKIEGLLIFVSISSFLFVFSLSIFLMIVDSFLHEKYVTLLGLLRTANNKKSEQGERHNSIVLWGARRIRTEVYFLIFQFSHTIFEHFRIFSHLWSVRSIAIRSR